MKLMLKTFWKNNKSLALFLLLMFVFRSAIADWNDVPTGSMKPTILEGDRIIVNKLAYDLRLPFTRISLVKLADPRRGEIAVFESQAAKKRLVKRVIGLPGDTLALRDNRLFINGKAIDYSTAASATEWFEHLPEMTHTVRFDQRPSVAASFDSVVVPAGHYLMLGDNRDNSADSRFIGFVPRDEFIGRTRRIALSLDYEDHYLPRVERFFHPLD